MFKKNRVAEAAMTLGTLGAGNVPMIQHEARLVQQYHADTAQAEAAQAYANSFLMPSEQARMQWVQAINQSIKDDRDLFMAGQVYGNNAENKTFTARKAEDHKLIDQRFSELQHAEQIAKSPMHEEAQHKADELLARTEQDTKQAINTGMELALMDAGIAYSVKSLLDARRQKKVNSNFERVVAHETRLQETVDSYVKKLDAETQNIGGSDHQL